MRTDADARTVLHLLRHAATDANLAHPPRLQGRGHNPPLALLGVRQAELTRDALAGCTIHHCYCSPMLRAVETARIVCAPHQLKPIAVEEFTECDVGRWEGMDWQTIRYLEAENYQRFMDNPAENGYPGGETLAEVHNRAAPKIDELLGRHPGKTILIVAHHVVNRTYLAGLTGLPISQARQVKLDNCGISVVIHDEGRTIVQTLHDSDHLHRLAA